MFGRVVDMVPFFQQKYLVYNKFIVLNSVIKTLKIEQFSTWIKEIQLDGPRKKQFSLLEKFSWFFFNKISHISREHFF